MRDDSKQKPGSPVPAEGGVQARRDFLTCLGKWSSAAIGGIAFVSVSGKPKRAEAYGWANRRGMGGGWSNRGGGGWANRRGLGGGWVNR